MCNTHSIADRGYRHSSGTSEVVLFITEPSGSASPTPPATSSALNADAVVFESLASPTVPDGSGSCLPMLGSVAGCLADPVGAQLELDENMDKFDYQLRDVFVGILASHEDTISERLADGGLAFSDPQVAAIFDVPEHRSTIEQHFRNLMKDILASFPALEQFREYSRFDSVLDDTLGDAVPHMLDRMRFPSGSDAARGRSSSDS